MSTSDNVEFDTDLVISAMRNGLDLNDCSPEDIEALKLDKDDDQHESLQEKVDKRIEEIHDEQEIVDATHDLACLGAKRKIGELDFQCTLGNIVLLNVIESPLVSGKLKGTVSFEDIAKSLYVLFRGKEALAPIMNIKERLQDLHLLNPMCKDNPEMCDRVMAKFEEAQNCRKVFAEEAIEFYNHNFTGEALQEVFDKMFSMINDVVKSSKELSSSAADSKKKAE
jgi:hypothetical protein